MVLYRQYGEKGLYRGTVPLVRTVRCCCLRTLREGEPVPERKVSRAKVFVHTPVVGQDQDYPCTVLGQKFGPKNAISRITRFRQQHCLRNACPTHAVGAN